MSSVFYRIYTIIFKCLVSVFLFIYRKKERKKEERKNERKIFTFQINSVLSVQRIQIKSIIKILNSTTLFNIDNKNKCFEHQISILE